MTMPKSVMLTPVMRLAWTCPGCQQLNYHGGKQRLPGGLKEIVEAAMDAKREEIAREGGDPADVVSFVFPPEVWCCNCGTQFDTTPDPRMLE